MVRIQSTSVFMLMLTLICMLIPLQHVEAASTSTSPYVRLFYYREGSLAQKSFLAHSDSIDIVAPQTYEINDLGQLSGSIDPTVLTLAKLHGIKVMPLVTNKDFTQASYQAILDNQAAQDALINALVSTAILNGYAGWEIDFEQMDASYKDKFSAFVARAYAAMKQNGLTLSVAVVAKISDTPEDYPNNLWQKLIGVYDYAALAAGTDFVSVMSYDDPYSKGPVAGYAWLQKVLAYSIATIPKEKISLGIPFYYWKWSDTTGKRIDIGGYKSLQETMDAHNTTYHYSATQQAPYLTYRTGGRNYTLWYENGTSIAQKIALIKKNGLRGFSGWALGLENPSIYTAIKR